MPHLHVGAKSEVMTVFRTRFAPSPTGYLHLGHAYAALTVFDTARQAGGTALLRIEDIDRTRCKQEFEQAIYDDLRWLGCDWPEPVRRQSDHISTCSVLDQLAAQGLIYRCFKTRREIAQDIARAPHHPGEGSGGVIYPGPATPMSPDEEAERLSKGAPFAWRLSITACREYLGERFDQLDFEETGQGAEGKTGRVRARPDSLGDVILGRKDMGTSYHLACTHDDALQRISHVIRGTDLFFATHLHRLLQELMGWSVPVYHHHPLIRDETGKRFAKRDRAITLRALRSAGFSPADLRARVGL